MFGGNCCIKFPSKTDEFSSFLSLVISKFPNNNITLEDNNRKDLYRLSLKGLKELKGSNQNIKDYLIELNMELKINFPIRDNISRGIQLINKTNQFNLNGKRYSEKEVKKIIDDGGSLITGNLNDKYGNHGEIISLLVDHYGTILSYVMSCRVFQREIEYLFLKSLSKFSQDKFKFQYIKTSKNIPFKNFLERYDTSQEDDNIIIKKNNIIEIANSRNGIIKLITS